MPIRNEHQATTGEMQAMRDSIRSMETRILLEVGGAPRPVAAAVVSAPVEKRSRRDAKRR